MDVSGQTIDKVSELMAENERLSKALEDERQFGLGIARKAGHTIARDNEKLCEKEKELCATRRALWLARGNYCHHFNVDWYIGRHPLTRQIKKVMEHKMIIAEMNCRAKAKEYGRG